MELAFLTLAPIPGAGINIQLGIAWFMLIS